MMHCKICETQSSFFFSTKILNKYDVDYFQCPSCGFVQTEEPYWLEEAYNSPITASDIGILMRNEMLVQLAGNIIVTFFDHDAKFLDYGAGYGLFVRMMRDRGIDFSWNDQYCDNLFAKGFEGNLEKSYELLTSFEVFEHLVDPLATIEGLLQSSRNILFSTELLPPSNPKAENWWYYSTHEGQHISIFTPKSLAFIADKFGLNLYSNGSFFHLLTEKNLDRQEFERWCQYSPEGFGKPSLLQRDVTTLSAQKAKAVTDLHTVQDSQNYSVVEREQPTIVIDGVFFQISNTGIARVWSSLLLEWSKTGFSKHIVVLDRGKTAPRIDGIIYRDICLYGYDDVESDRQLIQSVCDEENAILFISSYYTTPLTTPSAFMAYDMIPEVMNQDSSMPMWREKHRAIGLASLYFAISQNTAQDLIRFFPGIDQNSVLVAHCAASIAFNKASESEVNQFKIYNSISKPYFVLVGNRTSINGYKNAILFFKAFLELPYREQFDVICVGPVPELEPELFRYVDGYQVHLLQLSDTDLRAAYTGAIALVYPSKYEGFGLPILEAMACSCPVITCATSSIPEVAGNAAIFVDPDQIGEMVAALRAVQEFDIRQTLIKKGLAQVQKFSWPKTAKLVADRLLEISQSLQIQNDSDTIAVEPFIELFDAFIHQESNGSELDFSALRDARLIISNYYLTQSIDRLKVPHLGILGNAHRKLFHLKSGLNPLTEAEVTFISNLASHHLNKSNEGKILILLVGMLYLRADQIEISIDLSEVPLWLLENYIEFVCNPPSLFSRSGEVERYITYMNNWLRSLNQKLVDQPKVSRWDEVAWMTLQRLNAIPLYFSVKNVKEYFDIRARLVEHCLLRRGYQLSWKFQLRSDVRKQIRLGVFASHFTPQTETFATLPFYQSLNRNEFEIILISEHISNHRLERYCLGQADLNIQLPAELKDRVKCIRDLDLDILFIASNITAVTNHSLLLAAHRLARIQVTGMNSPTTTGLNSIDYYLSSSFVDSQFSVDSHYSETLILLNSAAQCFDFATEKILEIEKEINRDELGIVEASIVYCSGANFYKITPELEISWAQIILSVPDSVLMLYPFNPNWSDNYPIAAFRERINQTFTDYGLDLSRLILLDAAPTRSQVMNRLKLADIYLDSYPFSGMTSLIDPLILNMPTIVMEMDSACSLARGSAFLRELKAEELIAQDVQSYIDISVQLGRNVSFRDRMQDVIQDGMAQNPSFVNSDRYGKEISEALHTIFDDHQSQQILNSLEIRDKNLILFPNWNLDEDELFESMLNPIRSIVTEEGCERAGLLVYISDRDPEYADLLMTSILMHLISEEGIEIEGDGPLVDFLDKFEFQQKSKISEIYSLIEFVGEDTAMVEKFKAV
jgi:predicted O-linked N-acetylglucosamine transferase (SPINDLY family)/glycosyltransferase involved in cell wall biosynthesis